MAFGSRPLFRRAATEPLRLRCIRDALIPEIQHTACCRAKSNVQVATTHPVDSGSFLGMKFHIRGPEGVNRWRLCPSRRKQEIATEASFGDSR